MKTSTRFALLTLMVCAWSCGEITPVFDSNPNSLQKYLGVSIPKSVSDVHLAATFDGEIVVMQAKFRVSKDDFLKLISDLKMVKGGLINPGFSFKSQTPGDWWDPPDIKAQIKIEDIYETGGKDESSAGDLVMLWLNGYAYVHKFGPLK